MLATACVQVAQLKRSSVALASARSRCQWRCSQRPAPSPQAPLLPRERRR